MNEIATMARPTNALVPANISDAMRLAEFMARARTLPKHLWDSPGDCLMVVELAMRWGMSPFAVAQGISIISGKQMIEGKLVAAAVESSGAIVGQFDYDFAGEGDGRSITVTATRRGETTPRTVTVAIKDARTNNEMWKRQPDQQLVYHGARVWARRWTPAVILGVYSREEMGPIIEGEITSDEAATPTQRDQINTDIPLKAAAAATPRAPVKRAPVDAEDAYQAPPPPVRTRGQFLDALSLSIADALREQDAAEAVDRIICGPEVERAKAEFRNGNLERLNRIIKDALKAITPPEDDQVGEIVGEKYAAG